MSRSAESERRVERVLGVELSQLGCAFLNQHNTNKNTMSNKLEYGEGKATNVKLGLVSSSHLLLQPDALTEGLMADQETRHHSLAIGILFACLDPKLLVDVRLGPRRLTVVVLFHPSEQLRVSDVVHVRLEHTGGRRSVPG